MQHYAYVYTNNILELYVIDHMYKNTIIAFIYLNFFCLFFAVKVQHRMSRICNIHTASNGYGIKTYAQQCSYHRLSYHCRGSLRISDTGSCRTDSMVLQTDLGCSKRRFHTPGSLRGLNKVSSCLDLYTGWCPELKH